MAKALKFSTQNLINHSATPGKMDNYKLVHSFIWRQKGQCFNHHIVCEHHHTFLSMHTVDNLKGQNLGFPLLPDIKR